MRTANSILQPILLFSIIVNMIIMAIFYSNLHQSHPENHPEDVLEIPEMTEYLSKRNSTREMIFFIETTGVGSVRPRYVCGIESAARASPNADIYLLIAYKPSPHHLIYKSGGNEALFSVLEHHRNIQVLEVDMDLLFYKTPLEHFYHSGRMKNSNYLAAHTSDVLRLITLWKYGGKYFDLDFITVNNFTGLDIFVVRDNTDTDDIFANGIIGFPKKSLIILNVLKELDKSYDGFAWSANGPIAMTNGLKKYTGVRRTLDLKPDNPYQIIVLNYFSIFPIQFSNLKEVLFTDKHVNYVLSRAKDIKDFKGYHISTHVTGELELIFESNQAYNFLAKKYCPLSYWSCAFSGRF